ncbi:FixH family protein [Amycolatopsis sp. OK19-0408]|uniref:FixH family protein n=1 Tax=Amycolatopsis iheyensis TaxID=2945988 RepID=A0A9X2SKI1_9PSEU|nr:FixH family protein [Amycolatopsis iheyensis]MCR6485499.1 FixH family protein [Amycolatopsis iheyensis]
MNRPKVLIGVVALVVVAGVAWLLWPASDAKATTQQAISGPYTVQFSADAPRIGGNTFAVAVTGPAPEAVTVEPVMAQMGHAFAPVPAGPDGPGRFRAANVSLPMSGQWEITVSLRGPGGPAQVVFPLLVK